MNGRARIVTLETGSSHTPLRSMRSMRWQGFSGGILLSVENKIYIIEMIE